MSGVALAAALALLLAAIVRVPARRAAARDPTRPVTGNASGRSRPALRAGRARLRGTGPPRGASAPGPTDLGVLVTEVATRLRSGAGTQAAWDQTFARAGITRVGPAGNDGVPPQLAALGARARAGRWRGGSAGVEPGRARAGPASARPGPARRSGTAEAAERAAVAATVAACRLTHELGAPLADVLDRCAHGISEAAQAQDARRIALAGPRSTARLLGWLPGVGLVFGAGLGADPVGTLLDGSWGTASLLAGVGLLVAGHRWTRALVTAAERGGEHG